MSAVPTLPRGEKVRLGDAATDSEVQGANSELDDRSPGAMPSLFPLVNKSPTSILTRRQSFISFYSRLSAGRAPVPVGRVGDVWQGR